jgi:hypothetical protein
MYLAENMPGSHNFHLRRALKKGGGLDCIMALKSSPQKISP